MDLGENTIFDGGGKIGGEGRADLTDRGTEAIIRVMTGVSRGATCSLDLVAKSTLETSNLESGDLVKLSECKPMAAELTGTG